MKKKINSKPAKLFNAEHFGAFQKLDLKPQERNIVAFDTEDDSKGRPLAFSFYDGGRVLKTKSFYTRKAEEAVEFIYNYPVESIFVSHNLEYDLPNLFKYCDFMYVDEIIKAPLMMQVTLIGTKHVMMNSLSYFKGNVANMGKLVGLKKLEGKKKNALNKAYAIRDAEIVYRYMTMFQKRLVTQLGVALGLSIGSIAMQVYRSRFMDRNEQATYNNPQLVSDSYYGGRVEVFYRGITKSKVYVTDINSSYPNVMKNYSYPGNVRELENMIERAVVLAEGYIICNEDLELWDNTVTSSHEMIERIPLNAEELKEMKRHIRDHAMETLENVFVHNALERNNWNVTRAAEETGILRPNFQSMMKKLGISAKGRH